MDNGIIEILTNAIASVGFPVVAFGALFWYVYQKDKQHREEMQGLKTSLDNNSSVLNELKGLITYLVGELKK